MRSLLLALLFANLLVFASQFEVVRGLIDDAKPAVRAAQLNAERLRIVRDGSSRHRENVGDGAETGAQATSGTNSR